MDASHGEHREAPEDMSGGRPAPSSDVLFRVVDGEALLLDVRTGDYFSLDRLATEIWQRRSDGEGLGEISSTVGAQHSLDPERGGEDVEELVAELGAARLWI